MADTPQTIREYFPNIRIRTMAKDLDALRSGGGMIAEFTEHVESEEPVTFAQPVQEQKPVIEPPKLEPSPEPAQQKPRLEDFIQQPYPRPGKAVSQPAAQEGQAAPSAQKPENTLIVYVLVGVLGIAVLASIGYWVVFPRIAARLMPSPSPIVQPSPSTIPSELPGEQNPAITLKSLPQTAQTFTLHAVGTSSSQFFGTLQASFTGTFPASGTMMFFNTLLPDGTYASSKDMIRLFAPKSLPSFQATLGRQYILFAYWYKATQPAFGLVFSLQPDMAGTVRSMMTGWETSRIEQDFANLFIPATLVQRQTQDFTDAMIGGFAARMVAISRDGETTNFVYGFVKNNLIITTHAQAFEAVAKLIP